MVFRRNTPGRTRTCNLRLRRPLLYPVELQALSYRFHLIRSCLIEKLRGCLVGAMVTAAGMTMNSHPKYHGYRFAHIGVPRLDRVFLSKAKGKRGKLC